MRALSRTEQEIVDMLRAAKKYPRFGEDNGFILELLASWIEEGLHKRLCGVEDTMDKLAHKLLLRCETVLEEVRSNCIEKGELMPYDLDLLSGAVKGHNAVYRHYLIDIAEKSGE
jgi:hypothetical protein